MLSADWSILQFTLNGNIELSAAVSQFKTAIGRAPSPPTGAINKFVRLYSPTLPHSPTLLYSPSMAVNAAKQSWLWVLLIIILLLLIFGWGSSSTGGSLGAFDKAAAAARKDATRSAPE